MHFEGTFGQYGLRRKYTGIIKVTLRLEMKWEGVHNTCKRGNGHIGFVNSKLLLRTRVDFLAYFLLFILYFASILEKDFSATSLRHLHLLRANTVEKIEQGMKGRMEE